MTHEQMSYALSVFARRLLLFVALVALLSNALEFWFLYHLVEIRSHGAIPWSGIPTGKDLGIINEICLFIGVYSTTAMFVIACEWWDRQAKVLHQSLDPFDRRKSGNHHYRFYPDRREL